MSDAYKSSINTRLAKQYAAEALEKEREIRGYNPETKKFVKGVDELSRYSKGKLVSIFSTARDYFDKAGNISYWRKFDQIVQTYNQPVKEESKSSSRKKPTKDSEDRKTLAQNIYAHQREKDKKSDVDSAVERWKARNSSQESNGLEKKMWSIMAVLTLLASLFFVSSSLTGFAISNLTTNDLQWAGLCFFACGLVFAFLFLRKKYSSKHL
ncbi:MAG: hypothetical protein WC511_03565 [Candidatus Pacearchaeota archaeon]|jgi:hypothetical protein